MTTAPRQRIAIVHDWLVTAGGGEQVLAEVLREFPTADLFSSIDKMSPADRDRLGLKTVHASPLQSLPGIGKYYRSLLPVMPWAMRQLDVSGYDLVISISHAVAKGIVTHARQTHICLCLSPMRYAWEGRDAYLDTWIEKPIRRGLAKALLGRMRKWDKASSSGVTQFIAISETVRERISRCYGRESRVICPPVDIDAYATVLARLIADPGLRHTIGAAARRTSLTYSWEAASRSVETAYREVLARAASNASSTSRRRSLPK